MRGLVSYGLLSLLVSGVGAVSEVKIAIYSLAGVFIVLIVSLFILALRGVGPIFERGKTTKFRLAPIRDKQEPPDSSQK